VRNSALEGATVLGRHLGRNKIYHVYCEVECEADGLNVVPIAQSTRTFAAEADLSGLLKWIMAR